MTDKLDYSGTTILVTGGANGIGEFHSKEFARRGGLVIVNDIDEAGTERVVSEIKAEGGNAVANNNSVVDGSAIAESVRQHSDRLDVVVHNAGIVGHASITDLERETWDRVFAVNLTGAYETAKATWPIMRENGGGRMVFTSSPVVQVGDKIFPHYVASKSGLLGLCRSLAHQGRSENIFCNAVQPFASGGQLKEGTDEKFWEPFSPRFISALAAFLCHPSSQENGACFEVGAEHIHRHRTQMSAPLFIPGEQFSAETIADRIDETLDFESGVITHRLGEWATLWNEGMARMGEPLVDLSES